MSTGRILPLPKAPSLKVACLYGVGLDTERSYQYQNYKIDKVEMRLLHCLKLP